MGARGPGPARLRPRPGATSRRQRFAAVVVLVLVAVGAFRAAFAQSTTLRPAIDIAPGARVRVTVPTTGRFVGTVVQATSDSLRIELASGSSITLPTSRLDRLELSAGVQRHGWKGAGIGLLSGAVVGTAIGLATYRRTTCVPDPLARILCDFVDQTSREVTVAGDAALAGGAGALVGALIGQVARETWIRVPTIAGVSRVGFVGGPGLGVRLRI